MVRLVKSATCEMAADSPIELSNSFVSSFLVSSAPKSSHSQLVLCYSKGSLKLKNPILGFGVSVGLSHQKDRIIKVPRAEMPPFLIHVRPGDSSFQRCILMFKINSQLCSGLN